MIQTTFPKRGNRAEKLPKPCAKRSKRSSSCAVCVPSTYSASRRADAGFSGIKRLHRMPDFHFAQWRSDAQWVRAGRLRSASHRAMGTLFERRIGLVSRWLFLETLEIQKTANRHWCRADTSKVCYPLLLCTCTRSGAMLMTASRDTLVAVSERRFRRRLCFK